MGGLAPRASRPHMEGTTPVASFPITPNVIGEADDLA